jgi:hypothetical protein
VTLPTQTPANGDGWAAAATSGDIAYRTQSLKFQPVEVSLDESVNRFALVWLYLRAAAVSIIFWMVLFVIWLITNLSSLSNSAGGGGVDTSLLNVDSIIAFLLFWFVLLFTRTQEPIAEWRSMIEERAAAATSAYAAIYGSLRRRQIPLSPVALRVRSDVLGKESVNNRLVITERGYTAYVSVFPYGTSLYVGWLMFRNRRGYQLIFTFLKDAIGSVFGRSDLISQMLRTEKVRAMREALHYAAREGVDIAIRGIDVPLVATFGHDVPIQDLDAPMPSGSVGYGPAPVPAPDFGQVPPPHAYAAPAPGPAPVPGPAPAPDFGPADTAPAYPAQGPAPEPFTAPEPAPPTQN